MRKVIYGMSVSLDGFIEAANGDIRWADPDEELHSHFNEREKAIDVHFYGRRLYESVAAYWPTADENPVAPDYEKEYARLWKKMPKVVFSRTLKQVRWNARLIAGDLSKEVKYLKEQPGNDMSVSGARLAASFMQLGLIDEFWLYVHPIILGGGKPMFAPMHNKIYLELVEVRQFGREVVLLRYQNQMTMEQNVKKDS